MKFDERIIKPYAYEIPGEPGVYRVVFQEPSAIAANRGLVEAEAAFTIQARPGADFDVLVWPRKDSLLPGFTLENYKDEAVAQVRELIAKAG